MKEKILLMGLVFLALFSTAQDRTVTGSVTAVADGSDLPGVNVIVKGTTTGTVTDFNGNYSVEVSDEYNTLVFTSIGMASQEANIGDRSVIDIQLSEDVKQLGDVVVTALGIERNERALGYSVQTVGNDEVTNSGASNVVDALVGKASGVQVTRSSGSAGAGSRILIRGNTSMVGSNQPIIVIDGVRTNNESLGSEGSTSGTARGNRLMDLNNEDIESISILKGAAATSLYGTAGSRGVVIVTTKKGTKGSRISVNFSTTAGFDQITTLPQLQNEFAQGSQGVYRDPSTGASGSWGPRMSDLEFSKDMDYKPREESIVSKLADKAFDEDGNYKYDKNGFLVPKGEGNGIPAKVYRNTKDFFKTGVTLSNSLSVSGGSEIASFRFSASSLDQTGVVPVEGYKRKTASLASTLQASKKLSFEASLNYAKSNFNRIQQGSNTSGLMLGMLRTPASFDNSNGYGQDAVDNPEAYQFQSNLAQRNYRGGGGYDNPYWTINKSVREEEVNRVYGSFKTLYKLNTWINFMMNIGTDITSDVRKQPFDINSRTNTSGTMILDEYATRQTDFNFNFNGGGNIINDFTLNYMVGINAFSYARNNTYVQGDSWVIPNFNDISNASSISSISENINYRQLGFLGRVETGWRNIAFLTFSVRQDYDSRLGDPYNFDLSSVSILYPSVSMAFAFTELLPQNNVLTFGKVRVSWAQVGAPPPNAYSTTTSYETVGVGDGWGPAMSFPINGVTSFEIDDLLGNNKLRPELVTSTEVGLDLRLLEGRIGLDVAYFSRKTDDAILNATLAPETGYQNVWLNSGKLSTKGLEITLNATPVETGNFSWNTQLNFTKNQTIVDELAPGIESLFLAGFNSAGSYLVEGQPYGAIIGGAYLRSGAGTESDKSLVIPEGEIVMDNDPSSSSYGYQKTDQTKRAIGNANPDFILGWRNTFTYKNFTAGFLFDWKEGGDLYNGVAWALTFFGRDKLSAATRGESPVILDGVIDVSKPNEEPQYDKNNIAIVRDQNYWTSGVGGFGSVGEMFVMDAGWLRLREVSLSYSVPKSVFGNSVFKGANIGFIARNLWYNWAYNGVDPETSLTGTGNGQGFDYFNMPGTKSFLFKLSLNF